MWKHSGLVAVALLCAVGAATAQEKPVNYDITTNAYQFDGGTNTYSFEVRFSANPCPGVSYNIPFNASGMKDSKDAVSHFQSQIDKIAADVAKDERCHTH
jgi:hypothetical protein